MQVPVKQVWVYELRPTDTMRVLHAFMRAWEEFGDKIEIVRRGDRLYAIRTNEDS